MKLALTLICLSLAVYSQRAEACGCFTPPNPTVPVIQAGERILFAVNNGEVTAHVQVQYSGASGQEFGWLLPLPAVPTLELGTDEVFTQLTATTQPRYQMSTVLSPDCRQFFGSGAGGGTASGGGSGGGNFGFADAGSAGISPLVVQDSVGPYDYAVLRADSKTAMLEWLNAQGTSSLEGRTVWKYAVTLAEAAPDTGPKLPPVMAAKNGADETTKRRQLFYDSRVPRSLQGEVYVDAATSVVLKARLDGRVGVKGADSESELHLVVESTLTAIGKAPVIEPPKDFLPDEDKPDGIAAALVRMGIERKVVDAGVAGGPGEPEDDPE